VNETNYFYRPNLGRFLGPEWKKYVGDAISWESGKNVTDMCSLSAFGNYVPPTMIFPRKRISQQLQSNCPVRALYSCSKNGWITKKLFFECRVASSCQTTRLTLNAWACIYVLDHHVSHISLPIYSYCRECDNYGINSTSHLTFPATSW